MGGNGRTVFPDTICDIASFFTSAEDVARFRDGGHLRELQNGEEAGHAFDFVVRSFLLPAGTPGGQSTAFVFRHLQAGPEGMYIASVVS
jgi:hypothetical protein